MYVIAAIGIIISSYLTKSEEIDDKMFLYFLGFVVFPVAFPVFICAGIVTVCVKLGQKLRKPQE
jgi:hypothetical protein